MDEKVDIRLASADDASVATREQLNHLLDAYDLTRWLFTKQVVIDPKSIPHSHPVLTLHTRHLAQDDQLLSTFLHEQLHWFLAEQPDEPVEAAYEDLRSMFPTVPIGYPDGGDDEESTYLHLIINSLEYDALISVIGPARARAVLEFWVGDHYRWIYRMVLDRGAEIRDILRTHGLRPVAE